MAPSGYILMCDGATDASIHLFSQTFFDAMRRVGLWLAPSGYVVYVYQLYLHPHLEEKWSIIGHAEVNSLPIVGTPHAQARQRRHVHASLKEKFQHQVLPLRNSTADTACNIITEPLIVDAFFRFH